MEQVEPHLQLTYSQKAIKLSVQKTFFVFCKKLKFSVGWITNLLSRRHLLLIARRLCQTSLNDFPLVFYGLLLLMCLGSVQHFSSHGAIPFMTRLFLLNSRHQQFPFKKNVIIKKKSNLEGRAAPIHPCLRRPDDRI